MEKQVPPQEEQFQTALQEIIHDPLLQKDVQELLHYIDDEVPSDITVVQQFIIAAVTAINRKAPQAHFYYWDARRQESEPTLEQFIENYRQDFRETILGILCGDITPPQTLSPAILALLQSKHAVEISLDEMATKMFIALQFSTTEYSESQLKQYLTLYMLKRHVPKGWNLIIQYFRKKKIQELENIWKKLNMDLIYTKIKIGLTLTKTNKEK